MARVATLLFVAGVFASGCDLEGEMVGPRGGMIVSDDGRFSLEIAAGALDREVEITIETVQCGAMEGVAVGACYELGPRGTAFLFPAKVTVELDAGEIDGVAADRLALSGRREHSWDLLADRTVDVEDGTVCGSAPYLSSFAVIAIDEEPEPAALRDPAGQ